jgi:hypothetical protein
VGGILHLLLGAGSLPLLRSTHTIDPSKKKRQDIQEFKVPSKYIKGGFSMSFPYSKLFRRDRERDHNCQVHQRV